MSTRSSLVKFIVFVVATLLATGTLAATIANIQFGDKATYNAVFQDVTGLAAGQEVRIAGVRVGEVEAIKVARDRVHADVEFKVLRTSVLTEGTKATIKYRNLVGERYVALTQEVGGATPLQDGATLGLERTQSALDLTLLFNGFKPLFAALSPQDVNELSGNIISVLQGEGGNINSLLAKTASLTSTLADRDEVIGRTISNLNTVLGTVDERDAALKELIDQLQRFVSGLAADRETIGASLGNINSLTAQTADLLKVTRAPLKSDIAKLRCPDDQPQRAGEHRHLREVLVDVPRQDRHDHPHRDLRLVVQLLPLRLQRHHRAALGPDRGARKTRTAVRCEVLLMTVPFRERNPVPIGAAGLLTIAVLLLLSFNIQSIPFIGGGDTYRAAFSEAGGLMTGDDVRIAGVKVGKVQDVDLAGDHVVVDFKVTEPASFGKETAASVRMKTLLGQKYLALEPAGPGQLDQDSQIPLDRTVSSYDIVNAFSDLATTTERIDTGQLADVAVDPGHGVQGQSRGRQGGPGRPQPPLPDDRLA